MTDRDLIDQIMASTIYCTIATVNDDGSPWSTPVFFSYDDRLQLYWRSAKDAQHSRNLAARPQAAITVFNSEQPWGKGQGLYLSGPVEELAAAEMVQPALDIMDRRSPGRHQAADFMAPNLKRVYRFQTTKIWTNSDSSDGGQQLDSRRQLEVAA